MLLKTFSHNRWNMIFEQKRFQNLSHHPRCPHTLSYTSGGVETLKAAFLYPLHSCQRRYGILAVMYQTQRQRDTCSRPFLLLLWDEFFLLLLFLSCWLQRTSLDEAPQDSGESILLALLLFLSPLYVFWGAPRWSQRGGGSGALQMNAPAILVVRIKMCVLCVGERGRSPGGSGGGRVSQSDSDRCQAQENQEVGAKVWREEEEAEQGDVQGLCHTQTSHLTVLNCLITTVMRVWVCVMRTNSHDTIRYYDENEPSILIF